MATSLKIERASLRRLAAAIAFVMLMASLPSIGVIIISNPSGPSLSIDVCHPLQSLDSLPSIVPIARPAQSAPGNRILSHETFSQFVPILQYRFAESPDPPPPKLFC